MTSEFTVAVHALVYLHHKNTTLASEALAENVCTNPARIRKVMASLKRKGLICTKEGMNGGYQMAKEASDITLAQVGEALNAAMVKTTWHSGDPHMECMIASGMAGVIDGLTEDLNNLCFKHLEGITIQDVEDKLFNS